jgi:acyl-CoA reductase-like NAD-dependent aldehyde dehydrogenase
VCALITPWNHPLLIAVKKLAVALAAGNTCVVKPPELAPVAVLELAKILAQVGALP